MAGRWIVLLEAMNAGGSGGVGDGDVARLLAAVDRHAGSDSGGALRCPDRYALQVTTTATGPGEALVGVLCGWADALSELDLPTWQVVRAEVLAPEELERDKRDHLHDDPALVVGHRRRHQGCLRRGTSPQGLL